MNNQPQIIQWAKDCLRSKGYSLVDEPYLLLKTPWSNVIRFTTSKGDVYLKQTPEALFEPQIIKHLAKQFKVNVAALIAVNKDLHCFLMKDAGLTLRSFLKTQFQPGLLLQGIREHARLQRLSENHIASFLELGLPDWRLVHLPRLYEQIIQQTDFLKAQGLTDMELQCLSNLCPKIAAQCRVLSQCHIPETLVQPDFNTNNLLFNPKNKKMTWIDLGELAISHPFFSLHNFLHQATIHHGIQEFDELYSQLQEACLEHWLEIAPREKLLEGFILSKSLWPIYGVLSSYRLMASIDLEFFNSYYKGENQLAALFRKYMTSL